MSWLSNIVQKASDSVLQAVNTPVKLLTGVDVVPSSLYSTSTKQKELDTVTNAAKNVLRSVPGVGTLLGGSTSRASNNTVIIPTTTTSTFSLSAFIAKYQTLILIALLGVFAIFILKKKR